MSMGKPVIGKLCACGCGTTFYSTSRRKCLDDEHMHAWRSRRFEEIRAQYYAERRRDKFRALIRRTLVGGTLKESHVLALCQESFRMGYDAGYQKMFKRAKKAQAVAA